MTGGAGASDGDVSGESSSGGESLVERVVRAVPRALGRAGAIDERRGVEAVDLAWPRSVSGFAVYSIRTADLLMVGWATGAVGISALAFGFTVFRLLKRFATGFVLGTLSLTSQAHGEGDRERVDLVLKQSVWLALIFGVPLAAVAYVFSDAIVALLGADVEVIGLGAAYLQIVMIGYVFQFLNLVASRSLSGVGDTRTPMVVRSSAAVLNVVLNAILIFGVGPVPAYGVRGAAIATVVSWALTLAAFAWILFGARGDVGFRLGGRQWDWGVVRQLVDVSGPAIGRKVLQTAARFPILAIVAMFGTGAVAAYTVGRRVLDLAQTPMWGMNFAASVLVGQSLGDGDVESAHGYARTVTVISCALLIPLFLVIGVFPAAVGRLFVDDGGTLDLVVLFLRVYAIGGLGYTLDEVFSGVLTGAGDTRWPLYGTLIGLYLVVIPVSYVAGVVVGLGALGVAVGLLGEYYVPALVNVVRYRSGRWVAVQKRLSGAAADD